VSYTSAYIVVNASEERALARFSMLPDARLWGNSAQAYAYEDLSAYYRDRKEPVPASLFAEKCLLADSTNSRRWLNASVVFLNSGDKDREIHAYEKAIQLGTGVAWAYGNLGSEYIKMGRVDEAALLLRKALELDPQLPMAAYNLGSLLGSSKHEYREALAYLLRAVETDSTFPLAWLNVGTCLYEMGKYDEMIPYYERFLQLSPDDPAAPAIRQLVATVRTKH
jgi:tetratricopeptide (TPR) repeat protein